MRTVRNFAYFLIGFLLMGAVQFAFAETCSGGVCTTPATGVTASLRVYFNQGGLYRYVSGVTEAGLNEACAIYVAGGMYQGGSITRPTVGGFPAIKGICGHWSGNYWVSTNQYITVQQGYTCGGNTPYQEGQICEGQYQCPDASWTLNGQTCSKQESCPEGLEMVSGVCRKKCLATESRDAAGFCRSTCTKLVITPTGSCIQKVACTGGQQPDGLTGYPICSDQKRDEDKCPNGGIVIGMFDGKPMCLTPQQDDPDCSAIGGVVSGTLNGKPVCSKPDQNPPCSDGTPSQGTINGEPVCSGNCPSGSALGTVNGVSSCYPMGGTTDKTTTQKGDGETGTTTETETKDSSGNTTGTSGSSGNSTTTCTGDRCTTKSETTDGGGNKTTTTTTEDKGDYCAKNPKASVCTGTSDQAGYCKENPKAASCAELGEFGTADEMPTKSLGVSSIIPTIFSSNATCPSDINLPKGATFTFSSLCTFASGIRLFVLITAWLAAAYFVLGIKTD